jgi:electron transfer flavoprotein alpha subunit
MSNILVFLESSNGQLKRYSTEAITAAKNIASQIGGSVNAIILNDEAAGKQAGNYGADKVLVAKSDLLSKYSSVATSKVIKEAADKTSSNIVFMAASSAGKELSPRVSYLMGAGYIADIVALNNEGGLVATKPVYAGKAQIKTKIKTANQVYSLRPNVFTANKISDSDAAVEVFAPQLSDADFSAVVTKVSKSEGKLDVAEASIVVSGGRGLKEAENFKLVEDLAAALGAGVGASRAVVDAGWRPHSEQVGQTGKTVSPNLYVAVGISGAVQHLAGMSSSKFILAINKDKDAPIFKIADYGIVGDAFEVVPKITSMIKNK